MSYRHTLLHPMKLRNSPDALRSIVTSRKAVITFILANVALAVGYIMQEEAQGRRGEDTRALLRDIADELDQHVIGDSYQHPFDEYRNSDDVYTIPRFDAWENPLLVTYQDSDASMPERLTLSSAGRDEEHGTDDDMTEHRRVGPEPTGAQRLGEAWAEIRGFFKTVFSQDDNRGEK